MEFSLNKAEGRVTALDEGREIGVLDFNIQDGIMTITHTRAFEEGRGVGRGLVETAGDYALQQGLRVRPTCAYANVVMKRSSKYSGILTADADEGVSCTWS